METSDHLKNGATPKSQMSRKVTSIEMKTLNVTSNFWRQRIFRHGKILTILSGTFLLVFIYGCASLVSENYKSRIRAVNKLTDPNILYTVAKDDGNYYTVIASKSRVVAVEDTPQINRELTKKSMVRRYMKAKGIKDKEKKATLLKVIKEAE